MRIILPSILSMLLLGVVASAEETPLKDVKDMSCPVRATEGCPGDYCSKKVKRDVSAEHEGRKVYFCCKGCVKAFEKTPKTYLAEVRKQWQVIDAKEE